MHYPQCTFHVRARHMPCVHTVIYFNARAVSVRAPQAPPLTPVNWATACAHSMCARHVCLRSPTDSNQISLITPYDASPFAASKRLTRFPALAGWITCLPASGSTLPPQHPPNSSGDAVVGGHGA